MKHRESGRTGLYILLLLTGLILGTIGGGELLRISRSRLPDPVPSSAQEVFQSAHSNADAAQADCTASRHNSIVTATQRISACVVGIVVTQVRVVGQEVSYDDFFDQFFGPRIIPRMQEVESIGSGFVIDKKGLILTNNHVVEGAERLFVNFPDGRQFEGAVVGRDPFADLAVVRVSGGTFPEVVFGNSDELLIGEWAIAIGNPFLNFLNDPRPTVTVGVISAVNRDFAPSEQVYYQNMIQTDAAINQGNSGGPLVNALGEVIGINTFIFTGDKKNRGSIGIGFAIPSSRAKRVAHELIEYGKRRTVWTGITVQDLDRSVALALGIEVTEGVVVTDVVKGSSGSDAGLLNSDVIVGMGGRLIKNHEDLEGFFVNYFVGDTVSIEIVRKSHRQKLLLTLREYPAKR